MGIAFMEFSTQQLRDELKNLELQIAQAWELSLIHI